MIQIWHKDASVFHMRWHKSLLTHEEVLEAKNTTGTLYFLTSKYKLLIATTFFSLDKDREKEDAFLDTRCHD